MSLLQAQLWMGRISFIVCFCFIHVCSLWGLVVLGAVKVDRCSSAFAVVAASASDWSDPRSNHLFCITRLLHAETETKMPVVVVTIEDLHLQKILWKKCWVCWKSRDTHYKGWLWQYFGWRRNYRFLVIKGFRLKDLFESSTRRIFYLVFETVGVGANKDAPRELWHHSRSCCLLSTCLGSIAN